MIFSEDFNTYIPLAFPNVAQIGVLVTERFEFHDKSTIVCLDRNIYNDIDTPNKPCQNLRKVI